MATPICWPIAAGTAKASEVGQIGERLVTLIAPSTVSWATSGMLTTVTRSIVLHHLFQRPSG